MNQEKKWDMTKVLNWIADLVELAIALALVAGILVLFVQMVFEYGRMTFQEGHFDFSNFLTDALNLIIGIEFTRMLCRHTPDTIIEVLMFATARQLIVAHPGTLDTFLGVLSIGVLFVVRKYLLPDRVGDEGGIYMQRVGSFMNKRKNTADADNVDKF